MEDLIRNLVSKELEKANFTIDKIEYVEENGQMNLRIVIDKDGIIDLDDCVVATNIINDILDKEDPIEESYILDVCSKEKGGN